MTLAINKRPEPLERSSGPSAKSGYEMRGGPEKAMGRNRYGQMSRQLLTLSRAQRFESPIGRGFAFR